MNKMNNTNEPLSDITAEMRKVAKSTDLFNGDEVGEPLIRGMTVEDWADRIEAAVRYQFQKILNFCQAEIDSALSDHLSAIFMLKVVRDVAQNQLSKLSPTEGKEKSNAE